MGGRKRKGIQVITTDSESFFIINTNNWHHAVGFNIFMYNIYKNNTSFHRNWRLETGRELNQRVINLTEF